MRLSIVSLFMILTTIFLSGCGKTEAAAVDDRSQNFYGRAGVTSLANAFRSLPTQRAVPSMGVESRDLAAPTIASDAPHANANVTKATFAAPMQSASRWQWPVQGKVIESFGQQASGASSEGIVIAASEGTPIHAAQAGEVAFVGEDAKNYGNIVILRHMDGTMSSYSHASRIAVKKGDNVSVGSTIAYVGQTGNVRTPQLHFAVREGKNSIDPMTKLPHQMASN
ncbi:MAG: M23 family metallopeptidase [Rickettsiales bacterium]|nr:M23 family metallopeptidase [Rickettsiales bacterium]